MFDIFINNTRTLFKFLLDENLEMYVVNILKNIRSHLTIVLPKMTNVELNDLFIEVSDTLINYRSKGKVQWMGDNLVVVFPKFTNMVYNKGRELSNALYFFLLHFSCEYQPVVFHNFLCEAFRKLYIESNSAGKNYIQEMLLESVCGHDFDIKLCAIFCTDTSGRKAFFNYVTSPCGITFKDFATLLTSSTALQKMIDELMFVNTMIDPKKCVDDCFIELLHMRFGVNFKFSNVDATLLTWDSTTTSGRSLAHQLQYFLASHEGTLKAIGITVSSPPDLGREVALPCL